MRRVFMNHSIGAIEDGRFQPLGQHHESPLEMPSSFVRTQKSGEDSEDVPTEDWIGMSNGETGLAMPSTRRRSKKVRNSRRKMRNRRRVCETGLPMPSTTREET